MIHTNNPIIKHKAGLLNLAQELNNVSRACRVMGVSRDTFYRYQELVADGGIDALIDKNRRSPNLKNRVDESIELAVKAYAVEWPAHGQHRTSNELRKQGVFVSGSGVRSIWLRHDLDPAGRLEFLRFERGGHFERGVEACLEPAPGFRLLSSMLIDIPLAFALHQIGYFADHAAHRGRVLKHGRTVEPSQA